MIFQCFKEEFYFLNTDHKANSSKNDVSYEITSNLTFLLSIILHCQYLEHVTIYRDVTFLVY